MATEDFENECATADFIDKFGKWFNLINTYKPSVSVNEAKQLMEKTPPYITETLMTRYS